tara:strand:+ start:315 stop:518 length:204 start_codon:yes stop_codon:yes gene_type:complete
VEHRIARILVSRLSTKKGYARNLIEKRMIVKFWRCRNLSEFRERVSILPRRLLEKIIYLDKYVKTSA